MSYSPAQKIVKIPSTIVDREGNVRPFDRIKIFKAIRNAGNETKEYDAQIADNLTQKVVHTLFSRFGDSNLKLEDIQDIVEFILIEFKYIETARAYIAYRDRHKMNRDDGRTLVDVEKSINRYLGQNDWRVKANANQGWSLGGMILNVAGEAVANYWLNHIYSPDIGKAHRNGDFYIHDLDMLSGYCAGWSLRTLLREGFNGVSGKTEANPPKHLSSAVGQMVNFLGTLQNEWAGAQAFSSFDTFLAPYVRKDNLSYKEVKQCIQEFIYNLNVPSRWGSQTPFTNITLDLVCPDDLREQIPYIGEDEMPFAYGDLQKEMDMINKAYLEVMSKGDKSGRIFTFPIPTYNIVKDFDWNGEVSNILFDVTAKYGLPYFQNFLNSSMSPSDVRSMCCRLQLDLRELKARGNGLFGSGEQTGSIGVVTINCARLGYLYSGDKKGLYKRLDELLVTAMRSLETKRKVIQNYMDNGFFPFSKRYLGTLRSHFSTIGVNGINEMIRNFSGDEFNIASDKGQDLAEEFLQHILNKMSDFQEETGSLYNLEATPAEGTTYRLAKEDKKRYSDIIQAGTEDAPYYTNSSQLPVGYTEDPFEALTLQDRLQTKYTGGTVQHLYLGERVSSSQACKQLVKNSLENFHLPYITVSPTFSICPDHGYIKGEKFNCPKCGKESEVWTRVMGYHRPVSEYNKGKRSEYNDRKTFKVVD